jgi:hypothetical protein
MGGSIGVTLITPDGETYKMDRWTNSFPDFVNNMRFLKKRRRHINQYMELWLRLKADWDKNGPDGPFEEEGTTSYFPHEGMIPVGYGCLVIDMQKEKIFCMNSYASVGIQHARIYKDGEGNPYWDLRWDDDDNRRVKALDKAGKISIKLHSTEYDEHFGYHGDLHIDMFPFEVKTYPVTKAGALSMLHDLLNEYRMSDEEVNEWQKYIDERYEDEEDE